MGNILVGQSGGPTAVINASLAGVIHAGFASGRKVYGAVNGVEGILAGNLISLDQFKDHRMLQLLKQTPASYLGSCRKKLPDASEAPQMYETIFSVFQKYDITDFLYIGGNDSMDTVDKLSRFAKETGRKVRIAGVPKTIDNDLAGTDHTPGYGSAAKFVANAVRQISLDARVYDINAVTIVEIMGRNAGWLAGAASLAGVDGIPGADILCLPEKPFSVDWFLKTLEEKNREQKSLVVAISEGIADEKGNYLCEYTAKKSNADDQFAHTMLGGAGQALEHFIKKELGYKTRTVELNTLQRCFAQGASLTDVQEAFQAGVQAVCFLERGESGFMVCFDRKEGEGYEITYTPKPVEKIANLEKKIPASMLSADEKGVTREFIDYALPLIQGEPQLIYENGMVAFCKR